MRKFVLFRFLILRRLLAKFRVYLCKNAERGFSFDQTCKGRMTCPQLASLSLRKVGGYLNECLVRMATILPRGFLASGRWLLFLIFSLSSLGCESDRQRSGPMMKGMHGWEVIPLFTVGERLPTSDPKHNSTQYQPVGILDGLGAFQMTDTTIRILINHELVKSTGYSYTLENGTVLIGARISFFDVDRRSRNIVNSGIAYDSVFDRQGRLVTKAEQINQIGEPREGFSRFCSAIFIERGDYGLQDDVYLLGEEAGDPLNHPYGGSLWVLDVEKGILHGVAATGRMNFENIAPLITHGDRVAILIGDDTTPQSDSPETFGQEAHGATPPEHVVAAPIWLYIGKKNASLVDIQQALPPNIPSPTTDFLNRNGLLVGKLHYFVAEGGVTTVSQFRGTGSVVKGTWHALEVFNSSKANQEGFDRFGYKNGLTLRREAKAGGAFQFSRPEDISAHPTKGNRVVFASTGRGSVYGGDDSWGTLYQLDVDLKDLSGTLTVLYDGDDAGGGQVESPDHGIRSPDNVDWAQDGFIYVGEDNAKDVPPFFGSVSGEEASIWRLNPENGKIQRIAQMDRSQVLPTGTTDQQSGAIGKWEPSGIVDVSHLFGTKTGENWILATIQAHTIKDGLIQEANLVQGGQLIFLHKE